MPKIFKNKRKSKLSKCLKITACGKVMRKRIGKNHMLCKKITKRKAFLSKKCTLCRCDEKRIKKCILL